MFEIFLGSSLSRSTFNLIMKVTLISFAPNFMLVTTSKVCADGSRPFPSSHLRYYLFKRNRLGMPVTCSTPHRTKSSRILHDGLMHIFSVEIAKINTVVFKASHSFLSVQGYIHFIFIETGTSRHSRTYWRRSYASHLCDTLYLTN